MFSVYWEKMLLILHSMHYIRDCITESSTGISASLKIRFSDDPSVGESQQQTHWISCVHCRTNNVMRKKREMHHLIIRPETDPRQTPDLFCPSLSRKRYLLDDTTSILLMIYQRKSSFHLRKKKRAVEGKEVFNKRWRGIRRWSFQYWRQK